MPSNIWGVPKPLEAFLPTPKNIASSTNASPIEVTTSSPHGFRTGESVFIQGHLVNTAANGSWRIVSTSTTTFTLTGSTGNGVGAATGTAHLQGFGSGFQIPSALDDLTVASVNVAFEALAARTALLYGMLGWDHTIYKGGVETVKGTISIDSGGKLFATSGSIVEWASGSDLLMLAGSTATFEGSTTFDASSSTTFTSGAGLTFAAGINMSLVGEFDVDAGGSIVVKDHGGSSGFIKIEEDALLRVDAGGFLNVFGSATLESGSQFTLASGSESDFNGEIARTGPLLLDGNDAATGRRYQKFDGAGGHVDGDQGLVIVGHRWDWIEAPTLTANRVWAFDPPPAGLQADCNHVVRIIKPNADKDLTIKDNGTNNTIAVMGDGDTGMIIIIWVVEDGEWHGLGAYQG